MYFLSSFCTHQSHCLSHCLTIAGNRQVSLSQHFFVAKCLPVTIGWQKVHSNDESKGGNSASVFIFDSADVLNGVSREDLFSIMGDLSATHKLSHFVLSRETAVHNSRVFSSRSVETGREKNCIWSSLSSSTDEDLICWQCWASIKEHVFWKKKWFGLIFRVRRGFRANWLGSVVIVH